MLNTDGYSYDALHYPAQTLPCANTAAVYAYDVSGSLNSSIRVSSCTPIIFKDFTFLLPPICNYDGPPPLAHKFTGKERDSETGLDYFGARYYGSNMGRFLTPDWAAKPTAVPYAEFGDPQSLNLYSYVRNNPLAKADVDGHCPDGCVIEAGIVLGAMALYHFTSSPQGQQMIRNGIAAGAQMVNAATLPIAQKIVSFFSKKDATAAQSNPAPGTQAPAQENVKAPPPLVGNNPREAGSRTNTDLPGGHEAATQTFGQQTTGQTVRTDPKTGHQVAEDGSRLRLNPDGTARVDLPNRGSKPNGETIHFNDPDPKPNQSK
jgi:RHS repeat-associated protein